MAQSKSRKRGFRAFLGELQEAALIPQDDIRWWMRL
jgi:hypothetical protein